MIVIADTSPISYLILIDEVDVLPLLYREIFVPQAVFQELTSPDAPDKVRKWFRSRPDWFEIRELTRVVPVALSDLLDKGESEAIQLATELNADLILIDELAGRRVAAENGLNVIGLIGVLAAASSRGLIDADDVAAKLERTNFFISKDLIEFLRNRTSDE
jgi:predicted nucleic acid-binding protein